MACQLSVNRIITGAGGSGSPEPPPGYVTAITASLIKVIKVVGAFMSK